MNGEYTIELFEPDEYSLGKVQECLQCAFPDSKKFSLDFLRWQYLENPNGKVVSFNAVSSDGDVVAHYAAIPIQMQFGAKIEKGLLSLNTATRPDYQGRGLFTQLANRTYSYAKNQGFKYVIGVANANSTPGFLRKLGFYFISPLDFKVGVGPLNPNRPNSDSIHVLYNNDILKWRLSCPEFVYSFNGKSLLGSRKEPLFHTCVGVIPEWFNPTDFGLRRAIDIFNIYIGIGYKCSRFRYFNLPKFIKRSPFNLIFLDLTEGNLPVVKKENISFQLIDFDVA